MYLDSRLLKKMFTSKQIKTWLDVFATKLANFALEEFWVCHGKWKVSLSLSISSSPYLDFHWTIWKMEWNSSIFTLVHNNCLHECTKFKV